LLDEKRPLTRASAGADKRLLLTFGGSDPTRLTEAVLRTLTGMSLDDVSFTVVLGPGYGAPTPVELLVAALNRSTILRAPKDLLKVMADHDLVICGGGRTMYEAWVQGIPFMPIGSAAHEAQEIKGFLERGLIRFGLEEMDGAAFGRMLERFLQ
jgi:spore coat polysaccharide biosynthesis predicted glycosyltransferase SpsG